MKASRRVFTCFHRSPLCRRSPRDLDAPVELGRYVAFAPSEHGDYGRNGFQISILADGGSVVRIASRFVFNSRLACRVLSSHFPASKACRGLGPNGTRRRLAR